MSNYKQEQINNIVQTITSVKDYINVQAYSGDQSYKWIKDNWSTGDIVLAMQENKIYTKEATLQYLQDMAHLFGKDK